MEYWVWKILVQYYFPPHPHLKEVSEIRKTIANLKMILISIIFDNILVQYYFPPHHPFKLGSEMQKTEKASKN